MILEYWLYFLCLLSRLRFTGRFLLVCFYIAAFNNRHGLRTYETPFVGRTNKRESEASKGFGFIFPENAKRNNRHVPSRLLDLSSRLFTSISLELIGLHTFDWPSGITCDRSMCLLDLLKG